MSNLKYPTTKKEWFDEMPKNELQKNKLLTFPKKIIEKYKMQLLWLLTLTWLVGGGITIKNAINNAKEEVDRELAMEKLPHVTREDIPKMKKEFPAGRQKTEVNPALEKLQKEWVISPIATKEDIPEDFVNLKSKYSDKFVFHQVSYPEVHPAFANLLVAIANRFNEKLVSLWYSWWYVKPTITALSRPEDFNADLSNASKTSAHTYGIAADIRIVKDRFQTNDTKWDNVTQEDVFMAIFMEILKEFEKNWDIIVMTEKNPPHFHINMMKDWKKVDETFDAKKKHSKFKKDKENKKDKETQKQSEQNESISLIEKGKADFWRYLESIKLQQYDKDTEFGKYVRSMRRYRDIQNILKTNQSPIGAKYLMLWLMQESLWDPTSIAYDWWAGVIHFQPDVAEIEYWLNIFTDQKEYKKFKIRAQRPWESQKKYRNYKQEMYKLHWKTLETILNKYNYNLSDLENIDDRFHTWKCLQAWIKLLEKNYEFAKDFNFSKNGKSKEHQLNMAYAKENGLDIRQLYALNGYNKGRGSFMRNFRWSANLWWNHITHIMRHNKYYKVYDAYLEKGIIKWLNDQALLDYIQTEASKDLSDVAQKQSSEDISDRKESINFSLDLSKIGKKDPNHLQFVRESTDKQYSVYTYKIIYWAGVEWIKDAVSKQLKVPSDTILVTDSSGKEYKYNMWFMRGSEVFVKVKK